MTPLRNAIFHLDFKCNVRRDAYSACLTAVELIMKIDYRGEFDKFFPRFCDNLAKEASMSESVTSYASSNPKEEKLQLAAAIFDKVGTISLFCSFLLPCSHFAFLDAFQRISLSF